MDSAVASFQSGAFDYLTKPFDLAATVQLVGRAMQEHDRQTQGVALPVTHTPLLGQAAAMQEVFRAIGRLSQSLATVLITGESGTGKELVARALHQHSSRAQGPLVAINTAAIPRDLLESELFGHERGAFTGAQAARRGRFEQAEGGTLFLDEIGDMPLDLQTRLLRVLSDGQYYRVGGHHAQKANVRVIAATHQDLEQGVRQGQFREDLYHRLNVIRLRLPPLRERREDIPALAQHFLRLSAQQFGGETKQLSERALARLAAYDYPGNVRQLENMCHWLTVMAAGSVIEVNDLPPEILQTEAPMPAPIAAAPGAASATAPSAASSAAASMASAASADAHYSSSSDALSLPDSAAPKSDWAASMQAAAQALLASGHKDVWSQLSAQFEAALIEAALAHTRGRRIEAAQRLGLGRNTLTRKIMEYRLGGAGD